MRCAMVLCLSMLVLVSVADADINWEVFRSVNAVTTITAEGDNIWVGNSDLIMWDRNDGSYEIVNGTNKPEDHIRRIAIDENGVFHVVFVNAGYYTFDGELWLKVHVPALDDGEMYRAAFLTFDREDVLWLGLTPSPVLIDGKDISTIDHPFGYVNDVAFDSDNLAWIATSTGLATYDEETVTAIKEMTDRESNTVFIGNITTVFVADDDVVWFASKDQGLIRYDGTVCDVFGPEDGLPYSDAGQTSCEVKDLVVDGNGIVWMTQLDVGITSFDGTEFVTYTREDGLPQNGGYVLEMLPDGAVAAATENGVGVFSGGNWTAYRESNGPTGSTLSNFDIDDSGSVWCSQGRNGVSRFDGSWKLICPEWPVRSSAYDVAVDTEGVLWTSIDEGVARYDGDNWLIFTEEDGLGGAHVSELTLATDGSLWARLSNDVVSVWDGDEWSVRFTSDNLPAGCGRIWCVLPAGNNVVWIGTDNGLLEYDGDNFTQYSIDDGLPSDKIVELAMNSQGGLWIGCAEDSAGNTGGLSYFDGESFTVYTKEDGLFSEEIQSIYVDDKDVVWVGSYKGISYDNQEGGLNIIDGSGIFGYNQDNGFPGYGVYDIHEDLQHNIWLSTGSSLLKVSRYDLLDVPTAVDDTEAIPTALAIEGSFPNPFNPETTITFSVPEAGNVTFDVYNIAGQKVRTLESGTMSAGRHETVWNGRDDAGSELASGMYFSVLRQGEIHASHRMLLMK